ncbi:hypothetical protein G7Y89_g2122 [Cudoniella acicularis]|uniref:Uncharacterized protein n=1 Tax=Cudoniella acicularis TaxID=354080 RepID=A0A8H4RWV2_9HELO|nr:hypothetical protein G7Y89_g2122 [Cudoniella acicularis]
MTNKGQPNSLSTSSSKPQGHPATGSKPKPALPSSRESIPRAAKTAAAKTAAQPVLKYAEKPAKVVKKKAAPKPKTKTSAKPKANGRTPAKRGNKKSTEADPLVIDSSPEVLRKTKAKTKKAPATKSKETTKNTPKTIAKPKTKAKTGGGKKGPTPAKKVTKIAQPSTVTAQPPPLLMILVMKYDCGRDRGKWEP